MGRSLQTKPGRKRNDHEYEIGTRNAPTEGFNLAHPDFMLSILHQQRYSPRDETIRSALNVHCMHVCALNMCATHLRRLMCCGRRSPRTSDFRGSMAGGTAARFHQREPDVVAQGSGSRALQRIFAAYRHERIHRTLKLPEVDHPRVRSGSVVVQRQLNSVH